MCGICTNATTTPKRSLKQWLLDSLACGSIVPSARSHDRRRDRSEALLGLGRILQSRQNEMTKQGPRVVESAIGGFSEFANLEGSSSPNLLTFLDAVTVDEPRPEKDTKQKIARSCISPRRSKANRECRSFHAERSSFRKSPQIIRWSLARWSIGYGRCCWPRHRAPV